MADGCVFQTSEAQDWFLKKIQKKSRIIYNAVKEEFYHIERKPNRGEIVTCGRLTKQKNHAMLIAAFVIVICAGIYTSATPLLWTAVRKIADEKTLKYKVITIVAGGIGCAVACFIPYKD